MFSFPSSIIRILHTHTSLPTNFPPHRFHPPKPRISSERYYSQPARFPRFELHFFVRPFRLDETSAVSLPLISRMQDAQGPNTVVDPYLRSWKELREYFVVSPRFRFSCGRSQRGSSSSLSSFSLRSLPMARRGRESTCTGNRATNGPTPFYLECIWHPRLVHQKPTSKRWYESLVFFFFFFFFFFFCNRERWEGPQRGAACTGSQGCKVFEIKERGEEDGVFFPSLFLFFRNSRISRVTGSLSQISFVSIVEKCVYLIEIRIELMEFENVFAFLLHFVFCVFFL